MSLTRNSTEKCKSLVTKHVCNISKQRNCKLLNLSEQLLLVYKHCADFNSSYNTLNLLRFWLLCPKTKTKNVTVSAFIVLNFRSKICFCNILTGLPYFATKVMVILGVPYLYTVVADNKHDMIYQHCGVRTVLSLYQHCSQSTLLKVECYQTNIMFLFIIHRLWSVLFIIFAVLSQISIGCNL